MRYKILDNKLPQVCLLLFFSLYLGGCKKENTDYTFDYRRELDERKPSNVRLVNLSQNPQLIADGDSLTNFFMPPRRPGYIPPEESTLPGTIYFPKDGQLGQTWTVPQNLLSKDGTVLFKTTFVPTPTHNIASHDVEFTAQEDNDDPSDYYLLINHEAIVQNPDKVVKVPRSVTAPSQPDHFKIRIINFSKKLPPSNSMEDIAGAITLTYADGTPVGGATRGITEGQWSDYVEIPYGTYQFKILTADGRQIPAVGHRYYNNIDRTNSTMETGGIGNIDRMSSGLTYAPIQTFQPGGIYSIVVHPTSFTWSTGNDDIHEFQNGFQIITDSSEPQNRTYSQIQLANTVLGQDVLLNIKGQSTAATAYGTASDYKRVVSGKQRMEVTSSEGKSILSEEVELIGGQNYTVWLFTDQDNKVKALLATNNLAGTAYTGQESDGNNASIDRMNSKFFFNFRFLNFCPQVPYATFTHGDGRPFAGNNTMGQGINVSFGTMNILHPYVSVTYGMSDDAGNAYQFMAYSSLPTRIPGDWIKQIAPLSSEALVANKNLYAAIGRKVPLHEPGVYSIALIGKLDSDHLAEKARFMVVKHTK